MKNGSKIFAIASISILLAIILISLFISPNGDNNNEILSNDSGDILTNAKKESNAVKDSEKKDFIDISLDDLFNLLHKSEDNIVLIGRRGCQYCQIAEPILHKIAKKYNLNINYLSIDNMGEDDFERLIDISDKLSGVGTPVLLIIADGEVKDVLDGMTDTTHYVDFLKKNKFIK